MKKNCTELFSLNIIFLILLTISDIYAKVDILWSKNYGGNGNECGNSVQQTKDGGYIITGYTESYGVGGMDVWLIKTDANGDTLWTKTYGGSQGDVGNSVWPTSDDGYIITGYTESFGAGYQDLWLIKTDSNGDTLWTKSYGGSGSDWGSSVQETNDGAYIVTGTYDTLDSDRYRGYERDCWLLKIDLYGNTLWTKSLGGTNLEIGYSVQQTLDQGYVITGHFCHFSSPNIYFGDDVLLIKTDTNGDTLWTKTIALIDEDQGLSVRQTKDGGYIVSGFTDDSENCFIFLLKTDTDGDTLWTKTYGGSGEVFGGRSVWQTKDEGYFTIGTMLNSTWIIKTNINSDTLWTKTVRGVGCSGQQTTDEGYIITGSTPKPNSNNQDVWLIKTTSEVNTIKRNYVNILSEYDLTQNFPNPFNPKTTFKYSISKSDQVTISIYTISSQRIESETMNLTAGSYSYEFDGSRYSTGIYIYRISTLSGFNAERKMLFLK